MLALNQVFFFRRHPGRSAGAGFQILFDEPQYSMLGLQHVRLVYSVGLIPCPMRGVVYR